MEAPDRLTGILNTIKANPRKTWLVTACLIVVALLVVASKASFSLDLQSMFPSDSQSGDMFKVLRSAKLDKTIQLEIDTGRPGGVAESAGAIRQFVSELAEHPKLEEIQHGFSVDMRQALQDIPSLFPVLLSPDLLENADPEIAATTALRTLAMPGTPTTILRQDPFGWSRHIMLPLNNFQKLVNLDVKLVEGIPTDSDSQRTIISAQAAFQNGQPDAEHIRKLLDDIHSLCSDKLPNATISIVSPLNHNLENESCVKHDIRLVNILAAIVLIALFFGFYRGSLSACWIPVLPVFSTVLATSILAFFYNSLNLIILGICGGIAGLSVDQGIHVYSVLNTYGSMRDLSSIFKPLLMSVLTSALVFASLSVSGISAYAQLGMFSALILVINAALSIFLLPTLLKFRSDNTFQVPSFKPRLPLALSVSGAVLLITIISILALPKLKLDLSPTALDGTSPQTMLAEKDFQQRWTPQNASMMVVTAPTHDKLLERLEELDDSLPPEAFHLAKLWPSEKRMQEAVTSWQHPDVQGKLQALQEKLAQECQKRNLPKDFFAPFFQVFSKPAPVNPPQFVQGIAQRILRFAPANATALVFLPKQKFSDQWLVQQDSAFLSPEAFRQAALKDFTPRFLRVSALALGGLTVLLLVIYRSPFTLILVILPGTLAAIWCGGLAAATGFTLNLATCFSALMLTGLVLDYGIFAIHHRQSATASIPTALVLSAATTVLTAAALLFSRHPVLFHTGIVLFSGISVTCLAALFVVPAIYTVLDRFRKKSVILLVIMPLLLVTGCASTKRELTAIQATHEWQQYAKLPQKTLWNAKLDVLWYSFPMVVAVNQTADDLSIVAMSPTGNTLYSATRSGVFISDILPPIAKKRIFSNLSQDFRNIFAGQSAALTFPTTFRTPIAFTGKDGEKLTIGGDPMQLQSKRLGRFPFRQWSVKYGPWSAKDNAHEFIVYHNHNIRYSIMLTHKK